MSAAPESSRPVGRIITFYSYKGGTGRSMGLANVSWLLALSGFKVLVIDWDLEAPGLHRYFRPFLEDADLTVSEGIIDFVIHFVEATSEQMPAGQLNDDGKAGNSEHDPVALNDSSNLLPYTISLDYDFPGEGRLDLIPAGKQDKAYAVRVNSFNWKHFYEKLNGARVLEDASAILREEYDYILIDSRTGVSDTAGICTVKMPDDLVVCFTLNLQSIIGASAAAASVKEQREALGKPLRIFPVPMRVEPNEKLKTATMKSFAKPRFLPLLPGEMSEQQKEKYWDESDVPYIPFYAFEENLSYFRDELNSRNSVLFAMRGIAARLSGTQPPDLPKLDRLRADEIIAEYDSFSVTRTGGADKSETKTAVYLCCDSDSAAATLRSELQAMDIEVMTRAGFEPDLSWRDGLRRVMRRAAAFLIVLGESGLSASQTEELAFFEKAQGLQGGSHTLICNVLLPGAQPEKLPRLLLPYGVIDVRNGDDPGARIRTFLASPNTDALGRLPIGPYPGLNSFEVTDGPIFAARGALIERLVDAVSQSRLVALMGPRYSGRTSLVHAGLAPRLKAQESPKPVWDVRFGVAAAASTLPAKQMRDPAQATAQILLVLDVVSLAALAEQSASPGTPFSVSGWTIPSTGETISAILIVAETAQQVAACENALGTFAVKVEITPLTDPELMAAITEPAARAGLRVEPGLAARIVADLTGEHAQLPLLQYMLAELYSAEPPGVLTLEKYERLGGVGMVGQKCETVFNRLMPVNQDRCLEALGRLVWIPDSGSAVVQTAPETTIPANDRSVLDDFVSSGLIVAGKDAAGVGRSFRFADRIFLDRWPRLQRYVEDSRDFLVWRQLLIKNMYAWQANPRPFTLLSGEALAEARKHAAARSEALNEQERLYIDESVRNTESDLVQRSAVKKQQKKSYAWVAVAAALVLAAGGYFYNSQQAESRCSDIRLQAVKSAGDGQSDDALAQYKNFAAAGCPSDAQLEATIGTVYAGIGQPTNALKALDAAVKLQPDNTAVLGIRGDVNAQLGSIPAAQRDWRQVVASVPTDQYTRDDLTQTAALKPGQVSVILYDRGIPSAARDQVVGALQTAGFVVLRRPYGLAQPTNALWYGPNVSETEYHKAAQLLIENGIVLRDVKQANIGNGNIQVGYSAAAVSQPPIPLDVARKAAAAR